MSKPFNYGGQAVIEGVMMRGSRTLAVALRHPEGHIIVETESLNETLYRGPISRIPFLRGLVMLWDALGLGTKALMMSADVAVGEDASFSGPASWVTMLLGIGLGVGVFMLLPSFLVGLLAIPSEWLSSLLEGIVRLGLVVGYVWAVGYLPDMRRVFAYHGAEHKTVNAYEAGAELTVDEVRPFPTAHTRCGTAFLLIVVFFSVFLFTALGPMTLLWRLISRILLLPLLAGIAYEYLRWTAENQHQPLVKMLIQPNLALQRLTTNEPSLDILEVSIAAFNAMRELEEA